MVIYIELSSRVSMTQQTGSQASVEISIVKGPRKRKVSSLAGKDQSLMLSLGQPWVCSVSKFIFLASAYEGGWPFLSLTVSSSH